MYSLGKIAWVISQGKISDILIRCARKEISHMEMNVRPQCQETSSGLGVIKLFSCFKLTQLSIKFIKLINVEIKKNVGILTTICLQHMSLKARKVLRKVFNHKILIFISSLNFMLK